MPAWQKAESETVASERPVEEDQLIDVQLVEKSQGGDAQAFGRIYERHAPAVFRFLYARMDSRFDAEDLTEEVFLRAWRSLPGYQEKGVPFIAYLFRVARNALIDHYRRSKRINQLSLEERVIKDGRPGPGDVALAQIENEEVRQALNRLRDDYRLVLMLRFLGNLSPDETAEVMGKSSGAVRVLQHRALAALRKELGS